MTADEVSAVAKYAGRGEEPPEEDPVTATRCVGVRRQRAGLAFMLDLRLPGGERLGLPYSHAVDFRLTGNATIVLVFTTATVTITGRRLMSLYDRLVEQRVSWVGVAARSDLFEQEADTEPLVERISVETSEP